MRQIPPQDIQCADVQDILEEYFDDEVDTATKSAIASHMTTCQNCQEEARLAQAIREVLHELPAPEPPPEIFNGVAAHVRTYSNDSRWLQRITDRFRFFAFGRAYSSVLLGAGALFCLVVAALFGIHQHQQQQKIEQASREMHYALSKVQDVVERTGIVLSEKLTAVQLEQTSRRTLKRTVNLSSAIHQSLETLNSSPENIPAMEPLQRSDKEGDTQ